MPDPALPRYAFSSFTLRLYGPKEAEDVIEYYRASDVDAHLRAVEAAHQQAMKELKADLDTVIGDIERAVQTPYPQPVTGLCSTCGVDRAMLTGFLWRLEALREAAEARLSALQVTQDQQQ